MKQFENALGGTSVALQASEKLDDVPERLRHLITPEIEAAFDDPRPLFERIAQRTEIGPLAEYLRCMCEYNHWRLVVEDAYSPRRITRAGFYWYHPDLTSTTFVLKHRHCNQPMLRTLYDHLDAVYWADICLAGGLWPADEFVRLESYGLRLKAGGLNANAIIFGTDSCGDVFALDLNGKCAMLSHETGECNFFADFTTCCAWIFDKFLEGGWPDFNYHEVSESPAPDSQTAQFRPRLFQPDE